MHYRMALVILLWMSVARAEVVRVERVLDTARFPDVGVVLSDGKTLHVCVDGVSELRKPAYELEVQRLLQGAYVSERGGGTVPPVRLWIEDRHHEFSLQEIRWSFKRFTLTPSVNLLLIEKGLAKPATPTLEWSEGETEMHRELCALIDRVPKQIEVLRSKQSTLQEKVDAFEGLRAARLHAAAAVPLMLEMIEDPQGSFVDQALATLGFIGSDNPEHIAVLIPGLKRATPDFALRGLVQFEVLPRAALDAILDFVEAHPGRALSAAMCERIVVAVRHCGVLDAETQQRIDRLRKDKTRDLALRVGFEEVLGVGEK